MLDLVFLNVPKLVEPGYLKMVLVFWGEVSCIGKLHSGIFCFMVFSFVNYRMKTKYFGFFANVFTFLQYCLKY